MNEIIKYWDENLVVTHIGNEINWLFSYLDEKKIKKISYIDIGANVGKFYDQISEKYEIVKCIMVEPSEILYNHMVEKYKNKNNVELYNFAISDENGNFYFNDTVTPSISYYEKIGIDNSINLGVSKISKNSNGNIICYSMEHFLKNFNSIPFDEITFIKIDTENMDLQIIKSMTNTFVENNINPFILFENNYHNDMSYDDAKKIITDFCSLCDYETVDITHASDKLIRPKVKVDENQKVILTLTTVPDRLNTTNDGWGTRPSIERLLNLSYKNYEVHFNIPYVNKKTEQVYIIPDWLEKLKIDNPKLKIFRTDDYGPATKLVPTLMRIDKDEDIMIITVDDDLVYMDGFIEYHINARKKYPDSVLGFAGISSFNGKCHLCTTCDEDIEVRVIENYKTVSYKRNFFQDDFFSEFVGKTWSDDILISAYFGKHQKDKIVLNYSGDTDFRARVESFPIELVVPNNNSGCFLYRTESVSDNYDYFDKLGYFRKKKNESQTTIVTGLWDIRDNDDTLYDEIYNSNLKNLEKLLDLQVNLIVFGDEKTIKKISEKGKSEKVQFFLKPYGWFKHEFFEKIQNLKNNLELTNISYSYNMYLHIELSKIFLLNDAKIINTFNSDFMYWVELDLMNFENINKLSFDTLIEKLNGNKDKFIFPIVNNTASSLFFGGNLNRITDLNFLYYNVLSETLNQGLIGTNEFLFSTLINKNSDIIDLLEMNNIGNFNEIKFNTKKLNLKTPSLVKKNKNLYDNGIEIIKYQSNETIEVEIKDVKTNKKIEINKVKDLILKISEDFNKIDKSFWDTIYLTGEQHSFQRSKPAPYIKKTCEIGKILGLKTVVEIGATRHGITPNCVNYFYNSNDPFVSPPCCADGHGGVFFSLEGFDTYSVDIDKNCETHIKWSYESIGRELPSNLNLSIPKDGLEFLKEFDGKIDILFLDGWDVGVHEYAENHLRAFEISKDKLSDIHLILIDDTDFTISEGKDVLLSPHLISLGYTLLFDGRQKLYINKI